MIPEKISYDVLAGSTWKRLFRVFTDYDEDTDTGTAVDLRPYEIRMQGRRYPEAGETYFDFEKEADSSGTTGLEIQGADHNELLITLSDEVTTGFDIRVVLSDLRFYKDGVVDYWVQIDFNVTQSRTKKAEDT